MSNDLKKNSNKKTINIFLDIDYNTYKNRIKKYIFAHVNLMCDIFDEEFNDNFAKLHILRKKNLLENCSKFEKESLPLFKEQLLSYIENENNSYIVNDEEIKLLFEKSTEELLKDSEKINKKIIYVTPSHIESSKKLFDLFGIKYIHAPCEAESLLAVLCKNGIVDGCISEDTDILANGGCLFLRNFSSDKNVIEEYCLHGILDNLKLTYDQFVDLCILCGCDYTVKINGMGPITAYKLITQYQNIESIIENNTKFIIPENFEYNKARQLFKVPISDELYANLNKESQIIKPKIEDLILFLQNTKLKDKYFKEIHKDLMNYYLNINGSLSLDKSKEKSKKNLKNLNNLNKITDFFSSK